MENGMMIGLPGMVILPDPGPRGPRIERDSIVMVIL